MDVPLVHWASAMGLRRSISSSERTSAGRAAARTGDLVPELEVLISGFDPKIKTSVRRLVYSSPRLADLARVFPVAIHVLALRLAPLSRRRRALALVETGAQLKEVGAALHVPMWMRRLPAEAFRGPLPHIAQGDGFSRRIVNHLPRQSDDAAFWLNTVAFAQAAAGDAFALWLAQQALFRHAGEPQKLFGVLAAYAWYSTSINTRGTL